MPGYSHNRPYVMVFVPLKIRKNVDPPKGPNLCFRIIVI